ncbi:hypothetical protein [Nonomuraea wenchangensis]|uniref:hypothetical protein n=1 Tax=Nonomuraea wenchangensis TaxID=568860 RepID=UPI00331692AB
MSATIPIAACSLVRPESQREITVEAPSAVSASAVSTPGLSDAEIAQTLYKR